MSVPSATFDWGIKLSYLCEETTSDFRDTNELMRDYGMIIKTKSIHKVARSAGRKNLMIAGCYHVGTEAGGYIMEKEDILNHIWKSVNDKDFQAIYVAFVRDGHPIDVELLEVLPLE